MFASCVVSFQVIGELKDIQLCMLSMRHATSDTMTRAWQLGFGALNLIRRWMFLTLLVITVPLLVLYKKGDALSVCFNTIAILFMTEIDNVFYFFVLPERVRARVEAAGRVELTDSEAAAMVRTKVAHGILFPTPATITGP
eukprot:COSAG02_NODE_9923_length_2074_cov_1.293165_4_plen_141_part_00